MEVPDDVDTERNRPHDNQTYHKIPSVGSHSIQSSSYLTNRTHLLLSIATITIVGISVGLVLPNLQEARSPGVSRRSHPPARGR